MKIKVQDSGSGIDQDMEDKVFSVFGHEPKFQNSSSHGIGFSLFISQ